MKKIYFYPAGWEGSNIAKDSEGVYCDNHVDTELAIRREADKIHTTSMTHLSFDLLDMGYEIYMCYNGKELKMEPGMNLICGKELKIGHMIRRMFIAHVFDEDLGLDYDKLNQYKNP